MIIQVPLKQSLQLIQRKLSKGKSIDKIAEELEESVTVIQNLIGECEIK